MRLNRYLAQCGLGSRRSCEALIVGQRVQINDQPATLVSQVEAGDRVTVDGKLVQPQSQVPRVWMLHKPAGVVSTASDPQGRRTVVALVREQGIRQRVFPVGRLDKDTTGLLLLTNDGDLCYRLTHPSWEIDKEYLARVAEPMQPVDLDRLRQGIDLEEGRTAPCDVEQRLVASEVTLRLVLHEGRNRQVRRMLQAVGHPVLELRRVRIGPLELGDLPVGECRELPPQEVEQLERSLGLAPPPGGAHDSQ
jgi:pseudouridine synthase